MKIRISYMTIQIIFDDIEDNGQFHCNHDGTYTIYIHEGLSGPRLVDILLHELSHLAYDLHHPKGEESIVTSVATVLTEALDRNKNLRQLIVENLK